MLPILKILRRLTLGFLALFFGACVSAASLTTTYAGGNGLDANMFDVSSTSAISITQFDINSDRASSYAIYYRVGTWVGHATTPSDWTLLQTGYVAAHAAGVGAPVVLSAPFNMQANQVYSFYIAITDNGGLTYTDGLSVGRAYAADGVLTIFEGSGLDYPFQSVNTPRVWNGTIHYKLGTAIAAAPAPVPTLSQWGMILMSGILGLFGVAWMRKRHSN